jgi:hypothetical protein
MRIKGKGSRNRGTWVKRDMKETDWVAVVERPPIPQRFCNVELKQHTCEVLCAAAVAAVEFISFCSILLLL